MLAILGSFFKYLIVMVILAAVGLAGILTGKKLRECKDAKTAMMSSEESQ